MNTDLFESPAYASVIQRLEAAEKDGIEEFECMGRHYAVMQGVFPPTHFQSTGIFTRFMPYPKGGSFLEIGCGAGVTAVTAALSGCMQVVASDISEEAVENTWHNARRHGVEDIVSVRHGDLFDVLASQERFDVIFWNSNFVFVPEDHVFDKPVLEAFCDAGYAAHRRFLQDAPTYLKPGGKLLLGFSSQADGRLLDTLLTEMGYRSSVWISVIGKGDPAPRYDILQLHADGVASDVAGSRSSSVVAPAVP